MKKKFIVPIVLSSIGLLIDGLIYLGISSFPELLESEKSIQAKETNVFVNDTVVVENDKLFGPGATDAVNYVAGDSNYVPSTNNDDVTYIDAPASLSVGKAASETSKPSTKDFVIIESQTIFSAENGLGNLVDSFVIDSAEPSTNQSIVSSDHSSYYSHIEKADEGTHQEIVKTKKAKINKNKSVRSNEVLIETSLLVIGAVDIFSMILIHRRKHLFR